MKLIKKRDNGNLVIQFKYGFFEKIGIHHMGKIACGLLIAMLVPLIVIPSIWAGIIQSLFAGSFTLESFVGGLIAILIFGIIFIVVYFLYSKIGRVDLRKITLEENNSVLRRKRKTIKISQNDSIRGRVERVKLEKYLSSPDGHPQRKYVYRNRHTLYYIPEQGDELKLIKFDHKSNLRTLEIIAKELADILQIKLVYEELL